MSLYNSNVGQEKIKRIITSQGAHVHFIGILGAGMAPLAELLAARGVFVSGSDRDVGKREVTPPRGAVIASISALRPPDIVVYSLAVPENDREIRLAREMSVPVVSRAELLGAVMLSYPKRIGISGTHGKSTVTAIFDLLLSGAEIPHTTVSGAELTSGSPLVIEGDDAFVFEACEYRDSFLSMHPTVAVITNIELDHADYFRDEEHFYSSFERWAESARDLVLIGEGRYSSRLAKRIGERAYVFGSSDECRFRYFDVEFCDTGMDFSFIAEGKLLGRFHISAFGEHNVKNASAAVLYAYLTGIPMNTVRRALSTFRGIGRRLELLGYKEGRAVYYDYAHHPTEIECTLSTLVRIYGSVTCIFRPHTYTRTAALWREFAEALSIADNAVILDIYPAREEPIDGITSSELAREIGSSAVYLNFSEAANYCLHNAKGAIVLMGAGEVDSVKRELLESIMKK
ncbi:MAG: UDP-N-acetylmuramate--L-alanine ligase [Clostridia bacterium]|nr:UDP-N-acetylmuramate--L-alanine ligase [Clostridia bacterium]